MRIPKYKAKDAESIALQYGITDGLCLIGIRGYYEDSMGIPDLNDLNIYDDALLVVPMKQGKVVGSLYKTLPFNTDPSKRVGRIATLALSSEFSIRNGAPTPYYFIQGIHAGQSATYQAYRQYGSMFIHRANGVSEEGYFGINFHKGGTNNTSSLGCQTVPTQLWNNGQFEIDQKPFSFLEYLDELAKENPSLPSARSEKMEHGGKAGRDKKIVPYILLSKEEADRVEQKTTNLPNMVSVPMVAWNTSPTLHSPIPTRPTIQAPPFFTPTNQAPIGKPSFPEEAETVPQADIPFPTEAPPTSSPIKWLLGILLSLLGGTEAISTTLEMPIGFIDQVYNLIVSSMPEKAFKYVLTIALLYYGIKMIAPKSFIARIKNAITAFRNT